MGSIELQGRGAVVKVDRLSGGDITSFYDSRINQEVLWRRPREVAATNFTSEISQNTQDFYDNYDGGIQELFPNTADAATVLGAELPFHGELCRTGLSVVRQSKTSVELVGELKRYPVTVEKAISITDSGGLSIRTRLTNMSHFDLPYSWGLHPVFSEYFTGPGSQLTCNAIQARSHPAKFSERQFYEPSHKVSLQNLGDHQVLPLIDGLNGSADLIYVELREPWFLLGQAGKFRIRVSWDNPDFDSLWVWQECHSPEPWPWWGQHHIVGIEPHTAFPAASLEEHTLKGRNQLLLGKTSVSSAFLLELEQSP
jgi:hypothetical protein